MCQIMKWLKPVENYLPAIEFLGGQQCLWPPQGGCPSCIPGELSCPRPEGSSLWLSGDRAVRRCGTCGERVTGPSQDIPWGRSPAAWFGTSPLVWVSSGMPHLLPRAYARTARWLLGQLGGSSATGGGPLGLLGAPGGALRSTSRDLSALVSSCVGHGSLGRVDSSAISWGHSRSWLTSSHLSQGLQPHRNWGCTEKEEWTVVWQNKCV